MQGAASVVVDHTVRQVKTFLYNLATGTRHHEQIDSVTKQVAYQYQGRAVIELLQNAHDALRHGRPGGRGRVAFALRDEGEHGALYVANDGRPLRDVDARALAEVGLSSKSPATDVGNKGLGFRSVLDVSAEPAVYSCSVEGGGRLDGHCLRFSPSVAALVTEALESALSGRPVEVLGVPDLLADWSQEQREALRQRGREASRGWARREVARLSPYSLPVPADPSEFAVRLASEGYSTVVHIPLRSASARRDIEDELEEMRKAADLGLFLESLRCLTVAEPGGAPGSTWAIGRSETPPDGPHRRRGVTLTRVEGGERARRAFTVWTSRFGDDPEEREALKAAAAELPDDWSEVEVVGVDVAVEPGGAVPGRYSIYLPTEQKTGTGAHVNGPFYGELDRRGIAFKHAYNRILRRVAVELSAEVAVGLIGGGDEEGRAVVDLLSPSDPADVSLGPDVLEAVGAATGQEPADVRLVLSSKGWAPVRSVRVVDLTGGPDPLGEDVLNDLAGFARPAAALGGRVRRVEKLLGACGVGPDPDEEERADLVEAAAHAFPDDGDWDGFWEWALGVMDGDLDPLRSRRVLLVQDGRRLALDGEAEVKVFFPPQMGAASRGDIPSALAGHVAFLSSHIPLRQEAVVGAPATRARKALAGFESDLQYDAETIVRRVLLRALPPLPVPVDSEEGRLCAAALEWGARLYAERSDTELLAGLPVPCRGGWFRGEDAMFGPGWPGGLGEDLAVYLEEAGTESAGRALARLVVPPDHPAWSEWDGGGAEEVLERVRVARGLWLDEDEEPFEVVVSGGGATVERLGGRTWPPALRGRVEDAIAEASAFSGAYWYTSEPTWSLPGLEAFEALSDHARRALARVVLGSVREWERNHRTALRGRAEPTTWRLTHLNKDGGHVHRMGIPSPLALQLRSLPWVQVDDRTGAPPEWWLLPQEWADGPARYRYAYLNPLPGAPQDGRSRRALRDLGFPEFDPSEDGGGDVAAFLEAVAAGAATHAAPDTDLRSHARRGWERMEVDADEWPGTLVVEVGDSVHAWDPGRDGPCYLPPASLATATALREHGHPLLVIDPSVADRLSSGLSRAYGDAVRGGGSLRTVVEVGGHEWSGGGVGLSDSPVAWVVDVVLAAYAFAGPQGYGTGTDAFAKAHAALRGARVAVVDGLSTRVGVGGALTAARPTDAWWDAPTETLLVNRGAPLRSLARPLVAVVGRRDLVFPLASALSALDVAGCRVGVAPDAGAVSMAFEALGVDGDRRRDVEHAMVAEPEWVLRRALPVLALGGADPGAIETAHAVADVDDLFRRYGPPGSSPDDLIELCRVARSDADLGRRLFASYGVPLEAWNDALGLVGRPSVSNEKGPRQAEQMLGQFLPLARAALRSVAVDQGDVDLYVRGVLAVESAGVDAVEASGVWEVPLSVAASQAVDALARVCPAAAELVTGEASIDRLRQRLADRGVDLSDPEVVLEENRRVARDAAARLLLVWAAHRRLCGLDLPSPGALDEALDEAVRNEGFLTAWSPVDARRAVARRAAPPPGGGREGDHALLVAQEEVGAAALLERLGLEESDLKSVEAELQRRRVDEQRSKRTVDVAGTPFYADDLSSLWGHLAAFVRDGDLPDLDLAVTDGLAEVAEPERRGPRTSGGGGAARRGPQWRRDLTGLAGEIIAYRALRKSYGAERVTPHSWKSSNRALAHGRSPGDDDPRADDELGYDFEFDVDGVSYLVEVKASEGDRPAFEMGESEVRAAGAAAGDDTRRYMILRVSEALSASPRVRVLPNPYSADAAGLYEITGRGAVVSFRPLG